MQLRQLTSIEIDPSFTLTSHAGVCKHEQTKHTTSQAACEPAQSVQRSQQAATHMPQGKTLCGPTLSPCCGSGLCISTPSLVDATGTLCKAGPAGTSDLADSRHQNMQLDLQQWAGSAPTGGQPHEQRNPSGNTPAPAAPLTATPPTAAAVAIADNAMLPGSNLCQQLCHLTHSLLEAVRLQDRPRQQLVLQLLRSFPVTPQLLLTSQVGNAVRLVLQHAQKQREQQQADAVVGTVVAAADALRRQWRAVLQAGVSAADRSRVKAAGQVLQGTSIAKKPKLQQLLTSVAVSGKPAAAPTPTLQHQHLHLQQLPLARSTSMNKQRTPAPPAQMHHPSSDIQPKSPNGGSKLLSPAQKLQQLLSRSTTADAAAPVTPSKRASKCSMKQQHAAVGMFEQQADAVVQPRPNSLLQQLRAQQQQHPTLAAHQALPAQVKRSRASKSRHTEQHQQATGPMLKKQKVACGAQQQGTITGAAVSPQGVHSSWLTVFAHSSQAPAGKIQRSRSLVTGAALGAAGQPRTGGEPLLTNSSIAHDSPGTVKHTVLAPTPLLTAGKAPSTGVAGGAVRSLSDTNHHSSAAAAIAGCCAGPDSSPHHFPPHVTIRTGQSGSSGLGHNAMHGSLAGTAARGQQNAMWGAGAVALRAAKGPGHHGSHNAHHAHHATQHAARAHAHTVDNVLPSALPGAAAAATARPTVGSHHVSIGRHGSGAAGSNLASDRLCGIPDGRGAGSNTAIGAAGTGGRVCFGSGSTLINGSADEGGASKPLVGGRGLDGCGLGSFGGLGSYASGGLGNSGSLGLAGLGASAGAAGGCVRYVDSDDEGQPLLVDTRLKHGGSMLAGVDSMPLLGGGVVLSPSL